MSDEEQPQELESDATLVKFGKRRAVKRKGNPRKALSQTRGKKLRDNMQATVSAQLPVHHLPPQPAAPPPQHSLPVSYETPLQTACRPQATFVPFTALPTLFQTPNSTAHAPLQHIASPTLAGSHVSTLSLLNSLQDDKLALILPILVRMEHKIDQIIAVMGTMPNVTVLGSQQNAPFMGSQPNATLIGSQSNAPMAANQAVPSMTGSQSNVPIVGTPSNAQMVGSQSNATMGNLSNVTTMGAQFNGQMVGNQLNAMMGTQSNVTMMGTRPNAPVAGSQQNAVMTGTQSNASLIGTQSNAQMAGNQSHTTMAGTPLNTPIVGTQSSANNIGTHSNAVVMGTQSSANNIGTQSNAVVMGTQSNANNMETKSNVVMMGTYSNQANASAVTTQASPAPIATTIMETNSNANNLGIEANSSITVTPAKLATTAEELSGCLTETDFPIGPDEIIALKARANSSMNFAVRVLRRIFSHEELVGRNISGVRGKERVDRARVNTIRELVFKVYRTSLVEQEAVWRSCHKAMDSYLRGQGFQKTQQ